MHDMQIKEEPEEDSEGNNCSKSIEDIRNLSRKKKDRNYIPEISNLQTTTVIGVDTKGNFFSKNL